MRTICYYKHFVEKYIKKNFLVLATFVHKKYKNHISVLFLVCNTLLGTVPGWTDNMNGIYMLSVGVLKGVIRAVLADEHCFLDYTPVDFTINGIIVATWYNIVNNKYVWTSNII